MFWETQSYLKNKVKIWAKEDANKTEKLQLKEWNKVSCSTLVSAALNTVIALVAAKQCFLWRARPQNIQQGFNKELEMFHRDLVHSDSRAFPAVLSLAHCAANILFNIIPMVFYWVRSGKATGLLYTDGPRVSHKAPPPSLLHHRRYLTKQHFSIQSSGGRVLLQPICFKAQWVVRCEMPQCTLMLYSSIMCIFVAHLVAWMNVAILLSPQDQTADCMFLNHWVQLCAESDSHNWHICFLLTWWLFCMIYIK